MARLRSLGPSILAFAAFVGGLAGADTSTDDEAIRRLVSDYGHAIEAKDLVRFRSLKPALSREEEDRLRRAFESVGVQQVTIEVESLHLEADQGKVRVKRRDVIDRSIVATFFQTLVVQKERGGWVIREIRR
jgi:hypothetical protein